MYDPNVVDVERVGILIRSRDMGAEAEIIHRTGTFQEWDDVAFNAHGYPILVTVARRHPETGKVEKRGGNILSDHLLQKAYEALGAPEYGPLSDETPSRPKLAEYVDEAGDEAA